MKKHGLFFVVLLVFWSGVSTLVAQRGPGSKPPIKWGDIPPAHMAMDHYAADSNAAVVILADYGDVHFADDGSIIFDRHTRIKILSEAGYDWGTVSVPFLATKRRGQKVRNIKGQTFTRGPEGKLVRHKMEKKAIFTEDLDGSLRRKRFTLPALEPGAIIEYKYRVESENPVFLPDWQFQSSEPTLWSEYRAEIPTEYIYVQATVGMVALATYESEEQQLGKVIAHRWVMEDIPALREEPFMTTPSDFRAAIEFQLSGYSHPSVGTIKFMSSWKKVAEELTEMKMFGEQLKPTRLVRSRVEALTAGIDDPVEKMQALYDFVRTSITWKKERAIVASQKMNEVLETQSATSAEIALLLVSMLRAAEIESHPVLISTRSNGRIVEVYPILSQFNGVLVLATIDGTDYLLEATDPLRPYDLLSTEALNGKGWLVHEDQHEWININAAGVYNHQSYIEATLDASGALLAKLHTTDSDYSALRKRHQLKDTETPESFVEEVMLDDFDEVAIDSCTVTNEVLTEPLKTQTSFSVPGYAQVAGDFIYVNPALVGRVGENPLKLPERTFPVDMAYPRKIVHTLRLKLPEGYAVHEVPRNLRTVLPRQGGYFQRLIQVEGDVLMVQSKLEIARSVYAPTQYKHLRDLYDQVVAAEAGQVVLKRSVE